MNKILKNWKPVGTHSQKLLTRYANNQCNICQNTETTEHIFTYCPNAKDHNNQLAEKIIQFLQTRIDSTINKIPWWFTTDKEPEPDLILSHFLKP